MLRWFVLILAGWLAMRWLRPSKPETRRPPLRDLDPDRAVPAKWSEVEEEGADT